MAYFWNRKEIMDKFKANTKMMDTWGKKTMVGVEANTKWPLF